MDTGSVQARVSQIGDRVAQGEVIAEIETEKAPVEVQAPIGWLLTTERRGSASPRTRDRSRGGSSLTASFIEFTTHEITSLTGIVAPTS